MILREPLYTIIALACLLLSACTFGGFAPVEVVERSKEDAPKWVKDGETATEANGIVTVVHNKSKLGNLPLGAKEAQLDAYSVSERRLNKKVSDLLLERTVAAQITLINNDALANIIDRETKDNHGKYAVVSDIYYEKVRDSSVDDGVIYYTVFVRVDYPSAKTDELMSRVGETLRQSDYSDLKSLGNVLNGTSPSGLVGH